MQINIITLFPEFFASPLKYSLLGKAIEKEILRITIISLREFGLGKYRKTDDSPYGGGSGMVLMVEPIVSALRTTSNHAHTVLLSPAGKKFNQKKAEEFSSLPELTLICGHYEGVDERVPQHFCQDVVSVGDYVLSGGEIPALTIIESVARLLPGFMGNPDSLISESFSNGPELEYPQYTRPETYEGLQVPSVLLQGNHAEIKKWREKQSTLKSEQRLTGERAD